LLPPGAPAAPPLGPEALERCQGGDRGLESYNAMGRSQDLSPWAAQLQALREYMLPERYLRNFQTLDFPQQLRLCESKVLIF